MKKRKKLKKELAEMGLELKEDNTFTNPYGVKFSLEDYKEYKAKINGVNERRRKQLEETDNLPFMNGTEQLGDMTLRDRRDMLQKESPFLIKERRTSTINYFTTREGFEKNVAGLDEINANGTKKKLQIYRQNLIQGGKNIGLYQNNAKSRYIQKAILALPLDLFEKAFVNNELYDMDYMYSLENEEDRLEELLDDQIALLKPLIKEMKRRERAKRKAEKERQDELKRNQEKAKQSAIKIKSRKEKIKRKKKSKRK